MNNLLIIEKDGTSYIKLGYCRNLLINGEPLNLCPGNNNWAMINGKVTKIEEILRTPTRPTEFKLKNEFYGFGLSESCELSAFQYDEENSEYYGKNREFYEIVYSNPETYYVPVNFTILDTDCKPENVPSYVIFDFPYSLEYNQEVQHKYPCHIPMNEVFNILWDRIAEKLKNNPKYVMDNYKGIQTLTIHEIIRVPWGEKKTVHYYPNVRSKTAKTRIEDTYEKKVQILHIVGKYEHKYDNTIQIEKATGKDYYELIDNLEKYIQSFLSIFDDNKREVCPTCKGEGIICK